MTTEETIEAAAVMLAWAKGAKVQARDVSVDFWTEATMPSWQWCDYDYRIKPELVKRLLRPDELPPVFWLREKGYSSWYLVTKIEGDCIISAGAAFTLDAKSTLPELVEWSPDRKTAHSFFTEVV